MYSKKISCPALFITSLASNQGKTILTSALAYYYIKKNHRVSVFKTGPDYLDPMILEIVSDNLVEQIDLWMNGEEYCYNILYKASQKTDIILIEGAMGIFDGTPSSADLAINFNIPIVLIINVRGMAQSLASIIMGIKKYKNNLLLYGIFINNLGSYYHYKLIKSILPFNISLLGFFPKYNKIIFKNRHLGLIPPNEQNNFNKNIKNISKFIIKSKLINSIPIVKFKNKKKISIPLLLKGIKIGIAKDLAFSFIYNANIKLLESMGAKVFFFTINR